MNISKSTGMHLVYCVNTIDHF